MSNACEVCQKSATQTCSACGLAFYCSKEHQKQDWKKHKTFCVCYKVQTDQILGRCVVATRTIKPGEVIMKSGPLILGPKTASAPLCLGCHRKLGPDWFECERCRWPLCNERCQKFWHLKECQVFANASYKPDVKKNTSKQSVYSSVAPLRALLLKMTEPEKFKQFLTCQSHLDKHMKTPVYQILKNTLVPFFTNILKIDTNEREVLTICSIFDTNCFEVRSSEVNIRGLYPMIALLSHDCKHNTKHSFHGDNFDLILRATVPIQKGELITTTYTQTLWGTLERRIHLKMAKNFDCVCQRCSDPSEFGIYVGSTVCNECEEGKIVSSNPLEKDSDWSCQNCGFVVPSGDILWGSDTLRREIADLDKTNPKNLEEFLEKYNGVLHGTNSYSLQVKYALTQMYGNLQGYKLDELSDEFLERKVSLCLELLEVAEILEPGHSRFRGLLLLDLHEALMVKKKRGGQVLDGVKFLKEAYEILKSEPDLGKIVEQKMQSLG